MNKNRIGKIDLILIIFIIFLLIFSTINFLSPAEKKQTKSLNIALGQVDYSDNYIKNATDESGEIIKWNKDKIKYYIPNNDYVSTIESAFRHYEDIFPDYFKFKRVSEPTLADIEIKIADNINNKVTDNIYTSGLTEFSYSGLNGNLSNVKVTLVLKQPNNSRQLTSKEVYRTVLHEIGHAIGIVGHSSNNKDIMFPMSNERGEFSKRDIATINLIYSMNKSLLGTELSGVSSEKLTEAIDYTRAYPQNSIGWINLGEVYYRTKMYQLALEAYSKAIAINPDDYNAYYSLANCYLSSGKFDYAIKNAEIAREKTIDFEKIADIDELKGLIFIEKKDYKTAYKYFESALKANPNNKDYLLNFLYTCKHLNKKKIATKYLNKYMLEHLNECDDIEIIKIKNWTNRLF